MFGADTSLVVDALQVSGIALAVGAAGTWALLRRRKRGHENIARHSRDGLEQRVRVLERIATDRSIGLADEIEALRDEKEPA